MVVSGCGDNNNGKHKDSNPAPATKQITLSPSLGQITEGRAVLKNAFTGQAIADIKDITGNGTVTFTVDADKLKDPVIAEILPTASGKLTYADEAIKDKLVTINAPANMPLLRAAATITANQTNLAVTALTEAALTYAQSISSQFSQTNLNAANKMVAEQLKISKFNITDAPAIVGLNNFTPITNPQLSEQQRSYAAYLATLAKEAKRLNTNSTQPAYDILQALKKDLSDGKFDAKQGQATIDNYNSAWTAAWASWVSTFYDSIFKLQNNNDWNAWWDAFNASSPNIPTPTPPVVTLKPLRVVEGLEEYACSDESKLKSGRGGPLLDLEFINQSGNKISIDWIDYAGRIQNNVKDLANGRSHSIAPTTLTHPWKITDSNGKCKGIYVATATGNKTITIKANEIIITAKPINVETCASRNLPVGKLSDLTDYQGDYKENNNQVLNLNAATGKVVIKGTNADIKEVCGANVQNNGTNFYVITDKGYVTFFKDNAGKYTAESADFSSFYAEKVAGSSPTTPPPVVNPPVVDDTSVCKGSTNQWGCAQITGASLAAPIKFEHNSSIWAKPQLDRINEKTQALSISYGRKNTPLEDSIGITTFNDKNSLVTFVISASEWYTCGTMYSSSSVCPGFSMDITARTFTFKDVKLVNNDGSKTLTLNGQFKFETN